MSLSVKSVTVCLIMCVLVCVDEAFRCKVFKTEEALEAVEKGGTKCLGFCLWPESSVTASFTAKGPQYIQMQLHCGGLLDNNFVI